MKWPLVLSLALLALSLVLTTGAHRTHEPGRGRQIRNTRGGGGTLGLYVLAAGLILLLGLRFGWIVFLVPLALFPRRSSFWPSSSSPEDSRFR